MALFLTLFNIAALIFLLGISRVRARLLVSNKDARVEITFTLFILELYNFKDNSGGGPGIRFYRRLLSHLSELFERSEVRIGTIGIPKASGGEFSRREFLDPYRYNIAVSAAIAYLAGKSQKLIIDDNAIILIPDNHNGISFDIRIRTQLFYLAKILIAIYFDAKSARKESKKYVGN